MSQTTFPCIGWRPVYRCGCTGPVYPQKVPATLSLCATHCESPERVLRVFGEQVLTKKRKAVT